ncbi:hypothetical protein PENTCL1PPCAC_13988, partial [Pristionchus entomophagus]
TFLAGLVAAQNFGVFIPCGFVCTRQAAFTLFLDGVNSRVTCSDRNGDISARCNNCCQAYSAAGGLSLTDAVGFPASDGRSCVCCVDNRRCGGGGSGRPVPAAAAAAGARQDN